MSDDTRMADDEDDRIGRDGDGDGAVTVAETVAKMAAHYGVDPRVIDHECALYAWHMNELIASHRRFDDFKRQPQGGWRQWAARMMITDGRGDAEPHQ